MGKAIGQKSKIVFRHNNIKIIMFISKILISNSKNMKFYYKNIQINMSATFKIMNGNKLFDQV